MDLKQIKELMAAMRRGGIKKLTIKEKTGYDCAKWLVEYCLDNDLSLPKYQVHSMNPVGKKNILDYLSNFNIFKKLHEN